VVVAVNKLDLVDYSQEVFDQIESDYRAFAAEIGLTQIVCVPVSALRGDNITEPSTKTPWYHGPTLLGYLETVEVEDVTRDRPFRMPVQWVNRPDHDFRGYSGTIVGGTIRAGQPVQALPSGRRSRIARITTFDGDLAEAVVGQAVTLVLEDEIDVSRGDVLCEEDRAPQVADQFEATSSGCTNGRCSPVVRI